MINFWNRFKLWLDLMQEEEEVEMMNLIFFYTLCHNPSINRSAIRRVRKEMKKCDGFCGL